MEKYWICSVEGERGGVYKHPSAELAKAEAERLARGNPGKLIAVLEALCSVKTDAPIPPPCKWQDAVAKPDEIPF